MSRTITAHMIVKNEEQWVWYALKSLLDYMDQVLVFDTGSTDKTVEIIKTIKSKKIVFEEKGAVDAKGLTQLRQEQLEKSKTDWIFVADGDEIWPQEVMRKTKLLVDQADKAIYGLVIRAWNLIGDLKHFHPESENYQWPYAPQNLRGWMNLRGINRHIPGLHIAGDYPLEAYQDKKNKPIQNYGPKKLLFIKQRYFHMTYLLRSSQDKKDPGMKRGPKKIPEIGIKLPKNTQFPEVFYLTRPGIVASCWIKQSLEDKIKAAVLTPFKKIKRKIFK